MYWHLAHDTLQPTLRAVRGCPKALPREMWRADTCHLGTSGGSTCAWDQSTVRGMKPFIIFGLWAVLGLDAGAWAEALTGIPAAVGVVICVGIGAELAVAARRRIAAASTAVPETATHVSLFEGTATLDRAA